MKRLLVGLVSLYSCLAFSDSVGISYKYPTTKQNVPVEVVELSLQTNFLNVYVPTYIVNSQVGYGVGIGKAFKTNTGCPRGVLEPKIYYLDTYDYGRKNYGGPVQFGYSVGLECEVNKFTFGYTYEHVSNGSRYDLNPSLDTNTFNIQYRIE